MANKRELIEPNKGDKRYVRRDSEGRFRESDAVTRSLRQDVRAKARTVVSAGHGDKADRVKRAFSSASAKTGEFTSKGDKKRR
jgi:hypothetical protein